MTFLLLRVHLWSWRNRIRTRLRRLKQIRYLLSFGLGVGYLLLVWQPWKLRRLPTIGTWSSEVPEAARSYELGYGALLTLLALLTWVWPRVRPALSFTEAEIAFLFPAPLSRRQVVDFSLLKGQFGILTGAFFFNLFVLRGAAPSFLQGLLGTWLALSTLQLYFLGSAITRSSLLRHGRAGLRRALPALLAGASVAGLIVAWAVFWLRPPAGAETGAGGLGGYLLEMADAGPMRYLLAPGRMLVRPALVEGGAGALLLAWLPALLLLGASYLWVVRSDFAYEEASAERAARRASQRAAKRSGRKRYERVRAGARRPPFALPSRGRPEVALLWKNLIATGRFFSLRRLLVAAAVVLGLAKLLHETAAGTDWSPLVAALGGVCLGISGALLLVGPIVIRSDMRADLPNVALLKQYPLPGWSLVLGEVLAPTLLTTGLQVLLLSASLLLLDLPFAPAAGDELLLLLGFVILAAPLNLVSALVQNATVLLFPSWMVLGPDRARGLEALGQRLVGALIRLLTLAVIFLPAAALAAVGALLGYPLLGMAAAPLIALVAAGVLLAESGFGVLALGAVFERFDPSRELDVAT